MNKSIFSFFAVISLLTLSTAVVSAQTADYAPAGTPSTSCVSLTTNMGHPSRSNDVTTLQDYLIKTGYMTVESTGYFGLITQNAVINYQIAHGIEGTGYVGPLTRAAIQTESCGTTANAGTAGTTIAAGSVVCRAGQTCTRTVPAVAPAVCPLGYTCRPQTGTVSTVPTYVPGSLSNMYGTSAGTGSGAQQQMTAAQYQALLQSQGQAASTTVPNAGAGASAGIPVNITDNLTLDQIPATTPEESICGSFVIGTSTPLSSDPTTGILSAHFKMDYSPSVDCLLNSVGVTSIHRDDNRPVPI